MLRRVTSKAAVSRTTVYLLRRGNPSVVIGGISSSGHPCRRAFAATSAQKRALDAQQLKGSKLGPSSTAKAAKETVSAGSPVAESGGGGGGGIAPVVALLVATGGAGAAYYNGLLDDFLGGKSSPVPKKEVAVAVAIDSVAPTTRKDAKSAAVVEEDLFTKELIEVNEIIADAMGEVTAEVAAVTEAIESISEKEETVVASTATIPKEIAPKMEESPPAPVVVVPVVIATTKAPEPEPVPVVVSTVESTASPDTAVFEAKIMAEINELKKALHEKSDAALTEAHTELAKLSSMDVMGLDLDQMTNSQLKVRLVQMAKDLEERTKWEAVRLQEFLSMKEKEVEDRYVHHIQNTYDCILLFLHCVI